MAVSSILERLLIKFDPDFSGLNRGYPQAEREAKQFSERMGRNFAGINRSLASLNVASLVGAGGLVYGLQQTAREYTQATAASRIFDKQVERSGENYDVAAAAVNRLSDTFGVLDTDVQGSAAILLRAGVPLETIEKLLRSAGASALQSGFDVSQGFQNIAVGVAYGRSEIVETSGVVANASEAWKTYADQNNRTVDSLTQTEKAIAYANAIIAESATEVEDLGIAMAGLPGLQAAFNEQWRQMRRDVGEAVAGALVPMYQSLTDVMGFINQLPKPIKEIGVNALLAAGGATALATGVGALLLVLGPLTGPAGLLILAAAGVAALHTALMTEKDYISDVVDEYDRYRESVQLATQAQRDAAVERLEVLKGEMRERLKILEAQIVDEKGKVQNFIDSPLGRFLLPGFVSPEASASPGTVRQANELIGRIGQATIDQNQIRGGATKLFTPTPDRDTAPPTPPLPDTPLPTGIGTKKTLKEVFDDLGEAGSLAEQRAEALGNTLSAKLEAAEARAKLLDTALNDALELGAGEDAITNLVTRLRTANEEAATLRDMIAGNDSEAAKNERLERERFAGRRYPNGERDPEALQRNRDVNPYVADGVRDAQEEAQRSREIGYMLEEGQRRQEQAARDQAEAQRIINEQKERERAINLDLLAQARAIIADTQSAQAAAAQRVDPNEGRGGMRQGYIDYLEQGRQFTAFSEQLMGFTGTDAALDAIAESIRQAGVEAGITTQQMNTLLELYERMKGGNVLLVGEGFSPETGEEQTGATATGSDNGYSELREANKEHEEAMSEINGALISGLQSAFQSAAQQLGNAIRTGDTGELDVGGLAAGLIGTGAQFLGDMLVPGLGSFLGPILGSFLGGLFGGNDEAEDERKRQEDLSRRSSASSLEINLYFQQYNTFPSNINDTQTQANLRKLSREMVEDAYTTIDPNKLRGAAT